MINIVNSHGVQQKLHEIEEVAKNLEDALRKRSESDPQTPIITSARALGLVYQAKLESPSTSSLPDRVDNENRMVNLMTCIILCFI